MNHTSSSTENRHMLENLQRNSNIADGRTAGLSTLAYLQDCTVLHTVQIIMYTVRVDTFRTYCMVKKLMLRFIIGNELARRIFLIWVAWKYHHKVQRNYKKDIENSETLSFDALHFVIFQQFFLLRNFNTLFCLPS